MAGRVFRVQFLRGDARGPQISITARLSYDFKGSAARFSSEPAFTEGSGAFVGYVNYAPVGPGGPGNLAATASSKPAKPQ